MTRRTHDPSKQNSGAGHASGISLPAAALAQTVTLQQGQTINVQMQDTIDSGFRIRRRAFHRALVAPYPNDDATFANAIVNGR